MVLRIPMMLVLPPICASCRCASITQPCSLRVAKDAHITICRYCVLSHADEDQGKPITVSFCSLSSPNAVEHYFCGVFSPNRAAAAAPDHPTKLAAWHDDAGCREVEIQTSRSDLAQSQPIRCRSPLPRAASRVCRTEKIDEFSSNETVEPVVGSTASSNVYCRAVVASRLIG